MAHVPQPGSARLPLYLRRRWQRVFWPLLGLAVGGTTLKHLIEDEMFEAADCTPFAALLALLGLLTLFRQILNR